MTIFTEREKEIGMTMRQCATDYFKLILKNRELSSINEMLEIDNIKLNQKIEELEFKIKEYETNIAV